MLLRSYSFVITAAGVHGRRPGRHNEFAITTLAVQLLSAGCTSHSASTYPHGHARLPVYFDLTSGSVW